MSVPNRIGANRGSRGPLVGWQLTMLATWLGLVEVAGTAAAEPVKVELLSAADGVRPGHAIEMAVKFELPDQVVIGWEARGGVPATMVRLEVVGSAATVGRLRFPSPERHGTAGGGFAIVMSGSPVILTTINVPADAPSGSWIEIRGEATWAAAQLGEGGVIGKPDRGREELAVTLPVVAAGEEPVPINQGVFEEAAYAMPVEAGKAKHVKLAARHARGDGAGEVVLEVEVGRKVHIQAHEPGVEGLVGADVFVVPPHKMRVGEPAFPVGKAREVPYLGKVREYEGKVTLEIPLSEEAGATDEVSPGGPRVVRGVFLYQACDTKTNQCYPPEYVEWEVEVPQRPAP